MKAVTQAELEREYNRCIARERDRYRNWARTKQGAFETHKIMHFDAEDEESVERDPSASWLSDGGRGAAAIRRCDAGVSADHSQKKRLNRARMAVIRKIPECLTTFRLVIKNGKNRKESIWELMKTSRKRPNGKRPNTATVHN